MSAIEQLPLTTWWAKLALFCAVVFIGPLVEEIIYRGFLTKLLAERLSQRGVILAAMIFAVAHMER